MNEIKQTMLSRENEELTLQAADWLLRLSTEQVRADEILEWQRWLTASPLHRAAFERTQLVWETVPRIELPPWPTDREVMEDRSEDAAIPTANLTRHRRQTRTFSRRNTLALAAGLAVMAIGAAFVWQAQRIDDRELLSTTIGRNQIFKLPDGSSVTLGGASRLQLAYTAGHRSLTLEAGEAFFDVSKDPLRPFVVQAAKAQITAVGTAFNVRRTTGRVHVAVTSGAVNVAAVPAMGGDTTTTIQNILPMDAPQIARLTAGHQVIVASGQLQPAKPATVSIVLARKEGRLQYDSELLRDVVADLNRYSRTPIELADLRCGDLLVTGTVLEQDPEGWLHGLEKALPVHVEFQNQRILISQRQ